VVAVNLEVDGDVEVAGVLVVRLAGEGTGNFLAILHSVSNALMERDKGKKSTGEETATRSASAMWSTPAHLDGEDLVEIEDRLLPVRVLAEGACPR
jgi:hypothetical protein